MRLNNKGFTLIEILAVIVIIGILGGVAAVSVLSAINNGKEASYKIMISNIVTASSSLYDEVSNSSIVGGKIYNYNVTCSGNNLNGCPTDEEISINDGKIITNIQSLVSNGFLTGTNNDCNGDGCANKNRKVVIDPKSKRDIGACKIVISIDGVSPYESSSNCPSEYKKGVK